VSWRDYANVLQNACTDVFAERDADGEPKVFLEPAAGGPAVPLLAIYRDGHLEQLFETARVPNSTQEVRVDVKIADLLPHYPPKRDTAAAKGDRILVRRALAGDPLDDTPAVRFRVFDHQPDGEGMVRLMLKVAP
jgi:hypothetical protein